MNGVPRNVKLNTRLIETLQICYVCRKRKLGLTETSIINAKAEAEAGKEEEEHFHSSQGSRVVPSPSSPDPIHDLNNKSMQNAGMIPCPDGGLWVFPNKCESCKAKNFAIWDGCQKQKLREKGEQLRQ